MAFDCFEDLASMLVTELSAIAFCVASDRVSLVSGFAASSGRAASSANTSDVSSSSAKELQKLAMLARAWKMISSTVKVDLPSFVELPSLSV